MVKIRIINCVEKKHKHYILWYYLNKKIIKKLVDLKVILYYNILVHLFVILCPKGGKDNEKNISA